MPSYSWFNRPRFRTSDFLSKRVFLKATLFGFGLSLISFPAKAEPVSVRFDWSSIRSYENGAVYFNLCLHEGNVNSDGSCRVVNVSNSNETANSSQSVSIPLERRDTYQACLFADNTSVGAGRHFECHRVAPSANRNIRFEFAQQPPRSFPLRGEQHTELGDHRRMRTNIIISNNGRIDAQTRTWTDNNWTGFTGSVAVYISDSFGNVLYRTRVQRYGVNCRRCGGSRRTESWHDYMSEDLVERAAQVSIFHAHSPEIRVTRNDIERAAQLLIESQREE